MARVNVGVNPKYLTDQWLVAESVEITMITGSLRKNNFLIKSIIPEKYKLGSGHINFFKDKLIYLERRLNEVNLEMKRRNFKPGTYLDLKQYPNKFINNWEPRIEDSLILRERLQQKFFRKSNNFWRYRSEIINNMQNFFLKLQESPLYKV